MHGATMARRSDPAQPTGLWRSQSSVTDVGPSRKAVDALSSSPRGLREVSQQLVAHYMGSSDGKFGPVPRDRLGEVDTRYARAMFELLLSRGLPRLARERPPNERIAGCCRDFAVLFVAMAREKGIPARVRVGYATYFKTGWYVDHAIAEIWDSEKHRWRLVEPEITPSIVTKVGFDPLDVPRDRFVTGPRAWISARSGEVDPERFVVEPDLRIPYTRSWLSLRHHVIQDLAALNKTEMLVWDQWGILNEDDPLRHSQELDALARETSSIDVGPEVVAKWSRVDGFKVSPSVTSYSPVQEQPLQVDVRPALKRALPAEPS